MSYKNTRRRTHKKVHQFGLAGLCGCLALTLLIAADTPFSGQVAEDEQPIPGVVTDAEPTSSEEVTADAAPDETAVADEENGTDETTAEENGTDETTAEANTGSGETVTESGSGETVAESGSGSAPTEQNSDEATETGETGESGEDMPAETENDADRVLRQKNEKFERQIHIVSAGFYDELSKMREEIKPKPISLHGSADDEIGFFRRILGEVARWFGLVED